MKPSAEEKRLARVFAQSYESLNSAQKEAVDTIEGPVAVIAGPGTGKTQILALRIANILRRSDVGPENILALTFTRAGVKAMRQRLVSFIGPAAAYRVGIYTFHGFCEEQIKSDPEEFADFSDKQVADEITASALIEEALKELELEYLKTAASDCHYVPAVRRAIDIIKREGLSPEDFRKLIDRQEKEVLADENSYYKRSVAGRKKGQLKKDALKKVRKNRELAQVYELYNRRLAESGHYDFSDMIGAVLSRAENNPDFLSDLRERYAYVLVDEHQDTTDAQIRLLIALGSAEHLQGKPNIFLVGDRRQAIFRFAGAGEDNFARFARAFPEVKEIVLDRNYRSSQKILDAAAALMTGTEGEVSLRAARRGDFPAVKTVVYETYQDELAGTISTIKERLAAGVPPEEIAVLYRENKHLPAIVDFCERLGVPYVVAGTQNALTDPDLRKLFALIRACLDPMNNTFLSEVMLFDFLGLDSLDVAAVFQRYSCRARRLSLLETLSDKDFLRRGKWRSLASIKTFTENLARWKSLADNAPLMEFFETLVRESGFLARILADRRSVEKMAKLTGVFRQVRRLALTRGPEYGAGRFAADLETMRRYGLAIDIPWDRSVRGIRLMTAHAAKGLEFDEVYITNAVSGVWGGKRKREDFDLPLQVVKGDDEDERRLFFVAMTRARKFLHIGRAERDEAGKEKSQSIFLAQIADSCPECEKSTETPLSSPAIFAPRENTLGGFLDNDHIRATFLKSKLSASTLNNYLASPLLYFFRNLVKLPQAPSRNLIFGQLIHKALERYFILLRKEGAPPPVEKLEEFFAAAAAEEPLERREREQMLKRGREALLIYHRQNADDFFPRVETEKWIDGVKFSVSDGRENFELELCGTIDRLDLLGRNTFGAETVRLTDYKSGRSWRKLSRLEKDKLRRQMVFYKLLIDEAFEGRWELCETRLDFIEPDEKGVCHREIIRPNEKDLSALKEEISLMAETILTGRLPELLEKEAEKAKYDRNL
ncbi:MAG TPA: ATP-dependent helicase, partial [Candidatus Moranbacteria bacterium]|nr:ATP-dependent helicase [Candidatus Moranbacteria bacterium]